MKPFEIEIMKDAIKDACACACGLFSGSGSG